MRVRQSSKNRVRDRYLHRASYELKCIHNTVFVHVHSSVKSKAAVNGPTSTGAHHARRALHRRPHRRPMAQPWTDKSAHALTTHARNMLLAVVSCSRNAAVRDAPSHPLTAFLPAVPVLPRDCVSMPTRSPLPTRLRRVALSLARSLARSVTLCTLPPHQGGCAASLPSPLLSSATG